MRRQLPLTGLPGVPEGATFRPLSGRRGGRRRRGRAARPIRRARLTAIALALPPRGQGGNLQRSKAPGSAMVPAPSSAELRVRRSHTDEQREALKAKLRVQHVRSRLSDGTTIPTSRAGTSSPRPTESSVTIAGTVRRSRRAASGARASGGRRLMPSDPLFSPGRYWTSGDRNT
jgi:hypothetical protein